MKKVQPNNNHHAFMIDAKACLARHSNLTPMEMLALTAQLVGNLIAMQDQTKVTPAMAMDLVASNIEEGNQTAVAELMQSKGKA